MTARQKFNVTLVPDAEQIEVVSDAIMLHYDVTACGQISLDIVLVLGGGPVSQSSVQTL